MCRHKTFYTARYRRYRPLPTAQRSYLRLDSVCLPQNWLNRASKTGPRRDPRTRVGRIIFVRRSAILNSVISRCSVGYTYLFCYGDRCIMWARTENIVPLARCVAPINRRQNQYFIVLHNSVSCFPFCRIILYTKLPLVSPPPTRNRLKDS